MLWWYNLLLPSLFLRIFYALIRRRIFPYPTLQELRKRRKEVERAKVFGDAVQARLTPSSPFGIMEIWRIFKVFNKPKVNKAKRAMANKGKGKEKNMAPGPSEQDDGKDPEPEPGEAATVLDDAGGKQDKDGKRAVLKILGDIADLHERVKK